MEHINWVAVLGVIVLFLAAFGPYFVIRLFFKKETLPTEIVEGEVVKIKHTPTRVTRYTMLWLKLDDGDVKEFELNSSDVPNILHLHVGDTARLTYYPALIGLKLTALSFAKKEGVTQ